MKPFNFVNKNVQYFAFSNLIMLSLLFLINTDNTKNLNAAIIPLKTYYPKDNVETDPIKGLISSYNFRKIYLDIEVKSGQTMPTFLNYEQGIMHTHNQTAYFKDDKERYLDQYTKNSKDVCKYDYTSSSSYKSYSDFNISFYSYFARKASEQMIFYKDLEAKDKSIYEVNYLHVSNDTHSCLLAGNFDSKSPADEPYNLLHQVKKLINSQKFTWSLYFTNKDEGKFIIGDIIDNDKLAFYLNNTMENYIQIKQITLVGKIFWKIKVSNIYIGNYTNETNKEFNIDINSRYISVSEKLFDEIKTQYMLDNDACQKVITHFNYYITMYCDKNKYLSLTDNYKKLHNLTLNIDTIRENITFSPQELFLEKDDNLYFFIRVDKSNHYEERISIGTILLEKFVTVFDDDAKCLYILKTLDMIIDPSKDGQKSKKENTTLKIVLICVFSFILCAVIFIVVGKVYGKKLFTRKKKANELEDNFDYTPDNVKNENTKKGLLDDNEENSGNEENVQNNENGAINGV